MKVIKLVLLLLVAVACKEESKKEDTMNVMRSDYEFDLQGHRGARGLAPENTLPAFRLALQNDANTLEMDVVISKDEKVVVSHEPWFSPEICLDPKGDSIPKGNKRGYNLYEMTYEQIAKYDCGKLGNPRFPNQQTQSAKKPLLLEVIELGENYSLRQKVPVAYNIEIKSLPEGDGIFHPGPEKFADLVVKAIDSSAADKKQITLQSFDFRVLRYLNETYPDYTLAMLVEEKDLETNLEALGFTPDIYSPQHDLLTEAMVEKIHEKGMKVIPWTVNDPVRMQLLLSWGVDGLITDYPDRARKFKAWQD